MALAKFCCQAMCNFCSRRKILKKKHWCTCDDDSYKIMFLASFPETKLFEFQEGYIISTMVTVDMCEILRVFWEQDNKV